METFLATIDIGKGSIFRLVRANNLEEALYKTEEYYKGKGYKIYIHKTIE